MKWIWGTCCSEQITVLYTVTLYIFTSLQADTVVWVVWFTYKSFQIWHRSSSWTLFACKRGHHLHMWVRTDIPMLLLFLYHHNKVDPRSALQLTNDMSDHSVTITKNLAIVIKNESLERYKFGYQQTYLDNMLIILYKLTLKNTWKMRFLYKQRQKFQFWLIYSSCVWSV